MRKTSRLYGVALALLCAGLMTAGCGAGGKSETAVTAETERLAASSEDTAEAEESKEETNEETENSDSEKNQAETEEDTVKTPWFETGSWSEENVYSNQQAKISIALPEGWTMLSREQLNQVIDAGYEQAPDSQKKQFDMNMQNQQTVYDFGAVGTDGQSSLLFIVENIGISPITAKMGEDAYLKVLEKQLGNSGLDYTIEEATEREIAGNTWKILSAQCMGMTQWYAVHKRDERMETLLITVPDGETDLMEEVLAGVNGL